MPAKITKRNYYGLCLVIILRLAFCVWETALSKDLSTGLTFCPDTTGSDSIHPAPFSGGGHLPEGGGLLGILGGVCHPVPQILILFKTKKCHFPHPFSNLAFRQKIMTSLLRLESKPKNSSNPFRIRIFFSFFLIWKRNDKFIRSYTPHFETKTGNIYPIIRPKRRKNQYPLGGGTYLYGLYKGVPAPRGH